MAKLSDLQVALLLEEIACAMRVGTPVLDSMRRLESRRLGGIARAAREVAQGLERGQSVSDAFTSTESRISPQAAAAIEASKKSGDAGMIERIATQLRRRSDLARDTRIAWFYPWMLLALGYVVAVSVMAPLIRRINGSGIDWSDWIVGLSMWLESNWWLPPIIVVAIFITLFAWHSLQSRFPRSARLALFCNTLADQFTYDVPEDVAIAAAAKMSGDRDLMSIENPSLSSPGVEQIVSQSAFVIGSGVANKPTLIARLRYLGSVHSERARRQGYLWSRLVPRCAMVLIGGGLTLSYAWWVIAPVYLQVAQW